MAGHPRRAPRSPPLSSHLPAQARGSSGPSHGSGLARFNALSPEAAHAALLQCCGSRRWAHRVAAHRPYPDPGALLAAADEAAYDLSPADLTEALAAECSADLHPGAPYAAHTALDAAHAAYERRFGHAFVICLDGYPPEEHLDQVLAGIRAPDGARAGRGAGGRRRRTAPGRAGPALGSDTLADLAEWAVCAEIGLFAPVG